jgi:hypothetical protein
MLSVAEYVELNDQMIVNNGLVRIWKVVIVFDHAVSNCEYIVLNDQMMVNNGLEGIWKVVSVVLNLTLGCYKPLLSTRSTCPRAVTPEEIDSLICNEKREMPFHMMYFLAV